MTSFYQIFTDENHPLAIFDTIFPELYEIAISSPADNEAPPPPPDSASTSSTLPEETKKPELTDEDRSEKKKMENLRNEMKSACYTALAASFPTTGATQKKYIPPLFILLCSQASDLGNIGTLRVSILKAMSKCIGLIKSKEVIENGETLGSMIINVLDINLSDANSTQLRSTGLNLVKSLVENKEGVYACIKDEFKNQIRQRLVDLNLKFPGKHLEIDKLLSLL